MNIKIKIKDKIILGAISGALPTIILNVVDYLSLRLNLNKWHIWQIAGSLFFKKEDLTTIPALLLGGLTHTTLTSLGGIFIFYTLYYTGRSFYIIKGIGIFLLFWIALFGGILSLKITEIAQPIDAQTNMAHLFGHIMEGILAGLLIVKLADERVWD
jgi:hypothetical protein